MATMVPLLLEFLAGCGIGGLVGWQIGRHVRRSLAGKIAVLDAANAELVVERDRMLAAADMASLCVTHVGSEAVLGYELRSIVPVDDEGEDGLGVEKGGGDES